MVVGGHNHVRVWFGVQLSVDVDRLDSVKDRRKCVRFICGIDVWRER